MVKIADACISARHGNDLAGIISLFNHANTIAKKNGHPLDARN
jgi:hypothetical protein